MRLVDAAIGALQAKGFQWHHSCHGRAAFQYAKGRFAEFEAAAGEIAPPLKRILLVPSLMGMWFKFPCDPQEPGNYQKIATAPKPGCSGFDPGGPGLMMAPGIQQSVDRVRNARIALEHLDADLAHLLGAGYQRNERYRQLHEGTGDAPSAAERILMTRCIALFAEANQAIEALQSVL